MANLIIKPDTGDTLTLQDQSGTVSALAISTTGVTTLAGTTNNLGTVTAGTFAGALGATTTMSGNALRQCTPAAWVNWNGTSTVAVRDSYNVSSITDNGTGEYTINIGTDMANALYAAIGSAGTASNYGGPQGATIGGTWQVGNVMFHTQTVGGSHIDAPFCNCVIYGD